LNFLPLPEFSNFPLQMAIDKLNSLKNIEFEEDAKRLANMLLPL